MATFSERYGYIEKKLQIGSMSPELKNRIWNFYRSGIIIDIIHWKSNYLDKIMDRLGLLCDRITDYPAISPNLSRFRKWYDNAEWNRVFDFIEIYINFIPTRDRRETVLAVNSILSEENSGYRVMDTQIVPITNPSELECIEKAEKTKFNSVNTHIKKAVELFSKRPNPDYENTVKESISAVEAMCCLITGTAGTNSTLGQTIKKLKDSGVHIHPAMESAFSSLYGYTSDESGIRHGSVDFKGATSKDAKYMLVSCSAFVNYLIEKWSKINQ